MIFKKIMDCLKALVKAVGKQKDFTGSGVDSRYIGIDKATPGGDVTFYSVSLGQWNTLVSEKMALKEQLKAAADALSVIEARVCGRKFMHATEIDCVHAIAQAGYRDATK
jgi:hypothetical protein